VVRDNFCCLFDSSGLYRAARNKKAVEQRNNYATGGNFAANVQALSTKAEQI